MTRYYTGVGSRETPEPTLRFMCQMAAWMAERGWVLRSGGADGADSAFEHGAGVGKGLAEIYLPWRGFNARWQGIHGLQAEPEAFQIASRVHPAWGRLSPAVRKLHARNVFQVLGADLKTPSELLCCWTPGGADVGGTRTAIVLAREHGIPVFNLALPGTHSRLAAACGAAA